MIKNQVTLFFSVWCHFLFSEYTHRHSVYLQSLSLSPFLSLTTTDITTALCHAWCVTGSPRSGPGLHLITRCCMTMLQMWTHTTAMTYQHLLEITDDPPEQKKRQWLSWCAKLNLAKKKERRYRKKERRSDGEGADRRRAGGKENNSQLLHWRMPWLQIDQTINSLIIHSL